MLCFTFSSLFIHLFIVLFPFSASRAGFQQLPYVLILEICKSGFGGRSPQYRNRRKKKRKLGIIEHTRPTWYNPGVYITLWIYNSPCVTERKRLYWEKKILKYTQEYGDVLCLMESIPIQGWGYCAVGNFVSFYTGVSCCKSFICNFYKKGFHWSECERASRRTTWGGAEERKPIHTPIIETLKGSTTSFRIVKWKIPIENEV